MERCKLNYPILLVHGTGFRDSKLFNYWGRIPKVLESEGAKIYYGRQDGWGDFHSNAKLLKDEIINLCEKEDVCKVHIIAHSRGGLEARYLISSLKMDDYVSSLTTIATPHHGSKMLDIFNKLPNFVLKPIAWCVNLWYKLIGDKEPNFLSSVRQMNTTNMKKFNDLNMDSEKVYYKSYGFKMKHALSDFILWFSYLIIYMFEGPNDGIVSVESSKWTNYSGPLTGSKRRGISHVDEVDFRRMKFNKKKSGKGISDITEFYKDILEELKIVEK